MNAEPLVSVIIPSYNTGRYVAEAVASVLAQTYQHLEIIVINDGSTDDTEERLRPYFGKIRYFRQSNRGLSATRNRGIGLSRGNLIAFLDADDLWSPKKLACQVECLMQNPTIGLVHTHYTTLYADTGIRSTRQPHNIKGGSYYARLVLENLVAISSVVVRRECLDKVGLFDENIPERMCEDYDMWLRIARYFEFAYLTESLMLYRRHSTNMSNNREAILRDELYVLAKAFRADASLEARVGKQAVAEHRAELLFNLGYAYFNAGNLAEAGVNFGLALQLRFSPYVLMLWAATLLPLGVVRRMRSLKQLVQCKAHRALLKLLRKAVRTCQ